MRYFVCVLFALSLCFHSQLRAGENRPAADLTALLDTIGEIDGWAPGDEPEIAAGDDLFLLINGGAEIYQEYGFTQAIHQTYTGPNGRSINLELYEMNSPAAAYGIYSFKTGIGGTPVAAGTEGWLESYYLNFWKGRFLVTVIGLDTAGDVHADLIRFARAIDGLLPDGSEKPPLVSFLYDAADITYLRGNLALFNCYRFDTGDIFGLREGAVGTYEDHSVYIFQYNTDREAKSWYTNAKTHLQASDRFHAFTDMDSLFEITDRDDAVLTCSHYRRWIVIAFDTDKHDRNRHVASVIRRVTAVEAGNKLYPRYPHLLEEPPDIPSPFIDSDGCVVVTCLTRNNKYALCPVTIENGDTLDYRTGHWYGKGNQLMVDTLDFPALARTGLHTAAELTGLRSITGLPLAEITARARPGAYSTAGFIAAGETIESVLAADNQLVMRMGFTHQQMAEPLFHLFNVILSVRRDSARGNIRGLLYNSHMISLSFSGSKGWQRSIFNDEILGYWDIDLERSLTQEEISFLAEQYGRLSTLEFEEMVANLTHIHTGEMVPYYIMRYGFYEGHTGYRADPVAIAFIFNLKTIQEIETNFNGTLYETLTNRTAQDANRE